MNKLSYIRHDLITSICVPFRQTNKHQKNPTNPLASVLAFWVGYEIFPEQME